MASAHVQVMVSTPNDATAGHAVSPRRSRALSPTFNSSLFSGTLAPQAAAVQATAATPTTAVAQLLGGHTNDPATGSYKRRIPAQRGSTLIPEELPPPQSTERRHFEHKRATPATTLRPEELPQPSTSEKRHFGREESPQTSLLPGELPPSDLFQGMFEHRRRQSPAARDILASNPNPVELGLLPDAVACLRAKPWQIDSTPRRVQALNEATVETSARWSEHGDPAVSSTARPLQRPCNSPTEMNTQPARPSAISSTRPRSPSPPWALPSDEPVLWQFLPGGLASSRYPIEQGSHVPPHLQDSGVASALLGDQGSSGHTSVSKQSPRSRSTQLSVSIQRALSTGSPNRQECAEAQCAHSQRRKISLGNTDLDDNSSVRSAGVAHGACRSDIEECSSNELGTQRKGSIGSNSRERHGPVPWDHEHRQKVGMRRLSPTMRAASRICASTGEAAPPPFATDYAEAPSPTVVPKAIADIEIPIEPSERRSGRRLSPTMRAAGRVCALTGEPMPAPFDCEDNRTATAVDEASFRIRNAMAGADWENIPRPTYEGVSSCGTPQTDRPTSGRGSPCGTPRASRNCRDFTAEPYYGRASPCGTPRRRNSFGTAAGVAAFDRADPGAPRIPRVSPPRSDIVVMSSTSVDTQVNPLKPRIRALSKGPREDRSPSRGPTPVLSGASTPTMPVWLATKQQFGHAGYPPVSASDEPPLSVRARERHLPRWEGSDKKPTSMASSKGAVGTAWGLEARLEGARPQQRFDEGTLAQMYGNTLGALQDEIGKLQTKHQGLEVRIQQFQAECEPLSISGPATEHGSAPSSSTRQRKTTSPNRVPWRPYSPSGMKSPRLGKRAGSMNIPVSAPPSAG